MQPRKVQALGNRSYAITLPKGWITQNHIKPKTPVYVEETLNNELIIRKAAFTREAAKEISINVEEVRSLQERIVFCYVKNIDKVTITSRKPLEYKAKKAIRAIVDNLEGFKITDETPHQIEIRFLFKEVTITLSTITRRMIYLLRMMHDALIEKDQETVIRSELSIDRLYHLGERIIMSCLNNSEERINNDIQNQEELFYSKEILRRLEVIADITLSLKDEVNPKDLAYFLTMIDNIEQLILKKEDHFLIKNALEAMHYTAKSHAVDAKLQRIHDIAIDIVHAVMDLRFNRQYYEKYAT